MFKVGSHGASKHLGSLAEGGARKAALLVCICLGIATLTFPASGLGKASDVGKVVARGPILSYNQGLVLADYAMLYRATHDPFYLQRAEAIVRASDERFGHFGWDPKNPGDAPYWSTIYFRSFRVLTAIAPAMRSVYRPEWHAFKRFVYHHVVPGGRSVHPYPSGLYPGAKGWRYRTLWEQAQIEAAREDRGVGSAIAPLHYFWRGSVWLPRVVLRNGRIVPAARPVFYDDAMWASLDYLTGRALALAHPDMRRWGRLMRRRAAIDLSHVKRAWPALARGWDKRTGGERWYYNNPTLSTAATAGVAEVALRLYGINRDRRYLRWAERALLWLNHVTRVNGPEGPLYRNIPPSPSGPGKPTFDPLAWKTAATS